MNPSTDPNVANRYIETSTLDIGSRDITIVGLGEEGVWQLDSGSDVTLVSVGAGGNLTLNDVMMDGSIAGDLGQQVTLSVCDFAFRRGVEVEAGGDLVVDGGHFRCFFADHGSAINSTGGGVVDVYDTDFYLNVALEYGAHMAVSNATTLTISESTFEYGGVVSGSGGAVYVLQSNADIVDNKFLNNEAVVSGGALFIDNCSIDDCTKDAEIWGNTFQGNLAAVLIEYVVYDGISDTGVDDGELFDLETFEGDGGAVYADVSDVDMWNNLFCGNFADQGGAVHIPDPDLLNVQNNVFASNVALHYGGGMLVLGASGMATPYIVNNTFIGNEAGWEPETEEVFVIGGGAHMFLDGTLATIRNNILTQAEFGAGVGGVADEDRNWDLGEPFDIEYNLFGDNCDGASCEQNFSGDLNSQALSPTNLDNVDALLTYFGDEGDCYPDAFYPGWLSPAVNRGDPAIVDAYDVPFQPSDIGAYGGPRADVEDEDADGYADIYDCDDFDAAIHPEAVEVCDLRDNNCNGEIDEGNNNSWWIDEDGDSFGNPALLPDFIGCAPPAGHAANNLDCDDQNGSIYPDQIEICDDLDNDCDGVADEEEDLPYFLYYQDGDDDGYGSLAQSTVLDSCLTSPPSGFTVQSGDCVDSDADINPGALDICDGGVDNDCDTLTDEDETGGTTWYLDADEDAYGTDATAVTQCDDPSTDGQSYVDASTQPAVDCDDSAEGVNPGAVETCDGTDEDCSGVADDNLSADSEGVVTWYADEDGDGIGDEDDIVTGCEGATAPDGYFEKDDLSGVDDCDDSDPENLSEKCSACSGCNSSAAPTSMGSLFLLALGLIGRRRRR